MSESLAITPRNLGAIALPGYCPKCFRLLLDLRFHPPFCHFGGAIFNDAQRCQEAIVGYYLDEQGSLPKIFAPFCDCKARADCSKHWTKFRYTHKSGVVLYGSPDEVLVRKDDSLCIMDHKTAHFREDDPFHQQYVIQVVGYANIAEGLGLGEVTLGGLLYWDVQVSEVVEDPSDHFSQGRLWLPLVPKGLEIEIDYDILEPLIKELKAVSKAKQLPEGRDGCKDCKLLELLLGIEERLQAQDAHLLNRYAFDWSLRNQILSRQFRRQQLRQEVLREVDSGEENLFTSDGVVANWEFDPDHFADEIAN